MFAHIALLYPSLFVKWLWTFHCPKQFFQPAVFNLYFKGKLNVAGKKNVRIFNNKVKLMKHKIHISLGKTSWCFFLQNASKIKNVNACNIQGGRNGIILGEAPTNFWKKCHFFRQFYCSKSIHGPNLGEARASDFHQFRPPCT